MSTTSENSDLKLRTARTIKWNSIDKISTQVLYAITGIVLANVVSKPDFGVVGVVLIFQAFASLFVDSGFSSALIQRKSPDSKDYSTVFWFNLGMSIIVYILLALCAPLIARWFGDPRLVAISRVMLLTFVINATAIVQTNRLMKQMNVRMVAVSNLIALTVSGALGIALALLGYGAWALVWQSIVLAALKSIILWVVVKWRPMLYFSWSRLKSFFSVGGSVMATSFLNTVSQNIYQTVIGIFIGIIPVALYTQADKWSKMGIMSLSQTLTSTFLPLLSEVRDDSERFLRALDKTNRLASYLLFPLFLLLTVMAPPLFHLLFGTKWDDAMPLFQILMVRGIFTVLTLHYNNYILSMGKSRLLIYSEIIKDVVIGVSIILTASSGLTALVWGQLVAGILCWLAALILASQALQISYTRLVVQSIPYIAISLIAIAPAWLLLSANLSPFVTLLLQGISAAGIYIAINAILRSKIQRDIFNYVFHSSELSTM